ncbi:Asp23/Gls24 family envelope stress response protein [Aeromicrobium sp. CFBP 8757]|uniref:Asp23/Gls24 family envelope stress response protein n=1 Tax=Aeromicrobium sp. CFBP 8757 TaxID=2775288 RepID=UPI001786E0DB|nr:Asp23/Gls24 family envelope stress response protein [Aeromicrobium sp. CFBP 8757]
MSDTIEAPPGLAPAEERGTLDVRTKALEHLVAHAALQVPGCVARPAGLHPLTRSLPSASVTYRGSVAVADLHAAATWPCRVQELATTIRDTVRAEASRLSGTDIGRVDVTLHVVPVDEAVGATTSPRRVL